MSLMQENKKISFGSLEARQGEGIVLPKSGELSVLKSCDRQKASQMSPSSTWVDLVVDETDYFPTGSFPNLLRNCSY